MSTPIQVGVTTAQEAAAIINKKLEASNVAAGDGVSIVYDEQTNTVTVSADAVAPADSSAKVFWPVVLISNTKTFTAPLADMPAKNSKWPNKVYAIYYVNKYTEDYSIEQPDWNIAQYDYGTDTWTKLPNLTGGEIAVVVPNAIKENNNMIYIPHDSVLVYVGSEYNFSVDYNWRMIDGYKFGPANAYDWYSGSLSNAGIANKSLVRFYQNGYDGAITLSSTSDPYNGAATSKEYMEFVVINLSSTNNAVIFDSGYGAYVKAPRGKLASCNSQYGVVFVKQIADDVWFIDGDLDEDENAVADSQFLGKNNFINKIDEGALGTRNFNFAATGVGAYYKFDSSSLYRLGIAPISTASFFKDDYNNVISQSGGGSTSLDAGMNLVLQTGASGGDSSYTIESIDQIEDIKVVGVSQFTGMRSSIQVSFENIPTGAETGSIDLGLNVGDIELYFYQEVGVNNGNMTLYYTDMNGGEIEVPLNHPPVSGVYSVTLVRSGATQECTVRTPVGIVHTEIDSVGKGIGTYVSIGSYLNIFKTGGTVPVKATITNVEGRISYGNTF